MKKLTLAVLYGGRSGEHEVSLRSAASIIRHLSPQGYTVVPIGITREGLWYRQDWDPDLPNRLPDRMPLETSPGRLVAAVPGRGLAEASSGKILPIDTAFPIVHGTYGEDGTLQGFLETAGIPYTGGGVLGSALGMDKGRVKDLWTQAGLPVVPYRQISRDSMESRDKWEAFAEDVERAFGYPLFVKPVQAGSSVGVSRVEDRTCLQKAVREAAEYDLAVMAEPEIQGREIECSVIGNGAPIAFPPGEIAPREGFYDYRTKYEDPDGAKLLIPSPLPEETANAVRNLAREAYLRAGLCGFSRVDFFYREREGDLLLNEINTLPGFTSISMFPMLCAEGGVEYSRLLDQIIEYGLQTHQQRTARRLTP